MALIETTYLHIGTGKAGSTSIQSFLHDNYEPLKKLGYLVPRAAGTKRHFNLFHISSAPRYIQSFYRRFEPPRRLRFESAEAFTAAVLSELRDAHAKCAIFSDESLALSATRVEINKTASWLKAFSRNTIIIGYVRRQDLTLISRFQQRMRSGFYSSFDGIFEGSQPQLDYYRHLRRWAEVFGIENIRVVPFESESFYRNSLITDFANHLGLADEPSLDMSERWTHASISAAHLELLMRIGQRLSPRRRNEPLRPELRAFHEMLDQTLQGPGPSLPIDLARDFLARFGESNRRVALEFLGRGDGVLFRNPVKERFPVLGEALTLDVMRQVIAATLSIKTLRGRIAAAVPRVIATRFKLNPRNGHPISKALDAKVTALLGESPTIDAACDALMSLWSLEAAQPRREADKRKLRNRRRARRRRMVTARRKRGSSDQAVGTSDNAA